MFEEDTTQSAEQFPILVLDDDPVFREIVREVLGNCGYEIVEARNSRDATALINSRKFALAIVDFRLPDMDGMTWIGQIREAGKNLPVVFISSQWCDQKTFSWLRNILRVSLILQKPITPDLFVHQLEGLLPPAAVQAARHEKELNYVKEASTSQFDLAALPVNVSSIEDIDHLIASGEADETLQARLRSYRKRLKKQSSVNQARENYRAILPGQWTELTENINKGISAEGDSAALAEAQGLAHRILGTAGSLGYERVGQLAGKLEEFLKGLQTTAHTELEIFKSEIMRILAEGERLIASVDRDGDAAQDSSPAVVRKKLLVLTGDSDLFDLLRRTTDKTSELFFVEGAAGALMKAKQETFDGIIIDDDAVDSYGLSGVCLELRSSAQGQTTPLALVYRDEHPTEGDSLLSGFEVMARLPLDEARAADMLERLYTKSEARKPRVLIIDDDNVLTDFVSSILTHEGMVVETLNNPIDALNVVANFKPDLILLDVIMPGLSGYDVCRAIKQGVHKNVSVLFLTSQSSPEGRAAAFTAGGDDFLAKPVLTAELISRVQAHMVRIRSKRDNAALDDKTGLYTRDSLIRVTGDLLNGHEGVLSVALLYVEDFDGLSLSHGVLPVMDMLSGLGRLLMMRFRVEDIRGHWGEQGYMLVTPDITSGTLAEALQLLLEDFRSIKWTDNSGSEFVGSFVTGLAEYPSEEETLNPLLELAYRRALSARFGRTGAVK